MQKRPQVLAKWEGNLVELKKGMGLFVGPGVGQCCVRCMVCNWICSPCALYGNIWFIGIQVQKLTS
jgi:hypothetical protein